MRHHSARGEVPRLKDDPAPLSSCVYARASSLTDVPAGARLLDPARLAVDRSCVLDLFDEFKALVAELEKSNIDYALCGGLAMAVYGLARATIDIDILIRPADFERARELGRKLGYVVDAAPISFHSGDIEIRRISKLDPSSGDLLMLDLLLTTPAVERAFQSRAPVGWDHGVVWVVSRDGLIAIKSLRRSGQDLDDIARLQEDGDEG